MVVKGAKNPLPRAVDDIPLQIF